MNKFKKLFKILIVFIFIISINNFCNSKKEAIGSENNPIIMAAYWVGLNTTKQTDDSERIFNEKTKLYIKINNFGSQKNFNDFIEKNKPNIILISPLDFFDTTDKSNYEEKLIAIRGDSKFRKGQCMINKEMAKRLNIKSLKDTKGLRAAFVQKESQTGYLLPLLKIKSIGEDPLRFYKEYKFVDTHPNVVREVIKAKVPDRDSVVGFAYGGIHIAVSDYVEGAKDLIVLDTTPEIPQEILYLNKSLSSKTEQSIIKLFTSRYAESPFKRAIYKLYGIEDFTSDIKYDKDILLQLYSLQKNLED